MSLGAGSRSEQPRKWSSSWETWLRAQSPARPPHGAKAQRGQGLTLTCPSNPQSQPPPPAGPGAPGHLQGRQERRCPRLSAGPPSELAEPPRQARAPPSRPPRRLQSRKWSLRNRPAEAGGSAERWRSSPGRPRQPQSSRRSPWLRTLPPGWNPQAEPGGPGLLWGRGGQRRCPRLSGGPLSEQGEARVLTESQKVWVLSPRRWRRPQSRKRTRQKAQRTAEGSSEPRRPRRGLRESQTPQGSQLTARSPSKHPEEAPGS